MNNLKHSQNQLGNNTQTYKQDALKLSITLAIERTNTEVFKIDSLVMDVLDEFKDIDIKTITTAIKKGSLGLYGKTYKISTQEVCMWIREYLKQNKNKVSKEDFIGNIYNTFNNE